jgi:hypothetical protein
MRKFAIAAAILLLPNLSHAQDTQSEEPYWTPSAALIARLEAGLKIETFSEDEARYQLPFYDRYYYGMTLRGHRFVKGVLLVPPNLEDHPKTGVHVTEKKYMPKIHGAGCGHVYVTYDVDKNSSHAECDMLGSDAPPSEQPHWKPDEQTAARMESTIQEKMRGAGLPDLSHYSRYYFGITIDEKPMIRGRIEEISGSRSPPPGVHLLSESDDVPMLFDGGCGNITTLYDVKAAKFTELSCDGQGGHGVLSP